MECNDTNDLGQQYMKGEITPDEAVDEDIHACLIALQQIAEKMTLPMISGEISPVDFQAAFKAVSKKTTSSLSDMHYSTCKVLARNDSLAK